MGVFECYAWLTVAAVPIFAGAALLRLRTGPRTRRLTLGQVGLLVGVLAAATATTTILNSVFGCDVGFNPYRWRDWPF